MLCNSNGSFDFAFSSLTLCLCPFVCTCAGVWVRAVTVSTYVSIKLYAFFVNPQLGRL